MTYLETGATLSACGLYRYTLSRLWNPDRPSVTFCMLNPSRADAARDDPTIKKCVGFADRWGYGRLVVVNLFAFRATKPPDLRKAADAVGPESDRHIAEQTIGRRTVCAWGASVANWPAPKWAERARVVLRSLRVYVPKAQLCHLGLTKDGHPSHPLMLGYDTALQTFPEGMG